MQFFYPTVVGTILSVFTCYPLGDYGSFWVQQMDLMCYRGEHLYLAASLGTVGIVFGVVFPPVCLAYLLYRRRHKLEYERTMRILLFLYHSYKPEYYWWEVAKMVYILGLVHVEVESVWRPDPDRMAIFIAVLTVFLFANMSVRPHRFRSVYWLEVTGLTLVVVATYML